MKTERHERKAAELADIVGTENAAALMSSFGGSYIYVPRIKKHDKRIRYLKDLQYMQPILENGTAVDEVAAENHLSEKQKQFLEGLVKYCLNRYIKSFNALVLAVQPFSGAVSEKIMLLIGTAAFAALLEQYAGKRLYIPRSSLCGSEIQAENNDVGILYDLLEGFSVNETAARNNVSIRKVKEIYIIYCQRSKR